MGIHRIECFLAIVESGGFNRAATMLSVSQPFPSPAVRALERDLGSELFHRIGRRAVLAEAGRTLIEPARANRAGQLGVASMPSQAVANPSPY
nr:LysR family transcriptional regulator [Streptomyces endophyticus]